MKNNFKIYALGCLIFFISLESYSSYTPANTESHSKERGTVANDDPLKYITVNGSYRKNLIGDWVIEGAVANHATNLTYKDVVLRVDFYSKTKTLLGNSKAVIYDYFDPSTVKSYKVKIYGPKEARYVKISVLEAKTEPYGC